MSWHGRRAVGAGFVAALLVAAACGGEIDGSGAPDPGHLDGAAVDDAQPAMLDGPAGVADDGGAGADALAVGGDDAAITAGADLSGGGAPDLSQPKPPADLAAPPPDLTQPKPPPDPCKGAQFGDGHYCGQSLAGGDAKTLYLCKGGATAQKTPCAMGCHVAPPKMDDYCENPTAYHLPFCGGKTFTTTQGNNGDICGSHNGDHVGIQAYAWDFGLPRHTPVVASRGGKVTVAANVVSKGQNCFDGCPQPFNTQAFKNCCNACINTSNHVNVAHGDGSVATYWHLDQVTVGNGAQVQAGDVLGYSGTSGCSSGPHLHFQVMGNCPTGYCQSISISFAEAGKPPCGKAVTSQNGCH